MRRLANIAATVIIVLGTLQAQNNGDCLDCHDDPDMSLERNGKTISLNITPKLFARSAHRDNACLDCHVGFDPDEEPHLPVIKPVDCQSCHEKETAEFNKTGHRSEISCLSCHGNMHRPQSTRRLENCQGCHKKERQQLTISIHSKGDKPLNCLDCHSAHNTGDDYTVRCQSCHAEDGKADNSPLIAKQTGKNTMAMYESSIHSGNAECFDCHGSHQIFNVDSAASPVHRSNIITTCGSCHDDIAEEFRQSEHWQAFADGSASAPTCTDCHGEHSILEPDDDRAFVSRSKEVAVCLSCHVDSVNVTSKMTHSAGFVAAYETSIHGRAFTEGNTDAAICSDCHGAHSAMKASNPNSLVNKANISTTCGNCHGDIAAEFDLSVHGAALVGGNYDSPTCVSCHGEHEILEPEDKDARVAAVNVAEHVCGPCHNSVALVKKYGISSARFDSYNDSYHGLAVRFGDISVANCASCHGVHNIFPSNDIRSTIHPENLNTTCGHCHPGANENFAVGRVHITGERTETPVIFWITRIYLVMIGVTVGGMFFHNLIDWFRNLRDRLKVQQGNRLPISAEFGGRQFERMTLEDRVQHALLAGSFILLVITGFMLKFPEAWWVILIRRAMGESLFELRSGLHRVAAVVMVAGSLYHCYYAAFTQRGQEFMHDIWFRKQDWRDFLQQTRFNLGMSNTRPQFDRFNYMQKIEYWAVIWGTAVMTITGFALWFENQAINRFSKLFVDVCQVIHYYEAWLAFLAILVWHLYDVIFSPRVYPMSFVWLTGKVSADYMAEEHPRQLQRLQNTENEKESS